MLSETKLTQVDTPTVRRPKPDAARVTLVYYDDENPSPSTQVIDLPDGAQISFGRSRACDVRIDSERVSRTHAVFSRHGLEVSVADAGSRNGTWVNGELISGPRRLVSGDEVLVGAAIVVVNITSNVVSRQRMESMRYLEERLAAEVDRGLHFQRRFGLVLLALEGPADLTDEATDRISAALRPMEVIAEYAPCVLAIITPELDAPATEAAARGFAATGRDEHAPELRVAVGVAAFPDHSTTVGGLIARARAASSAAARRRRGRRASGR